MFGAEHLRYSRGMTQMLNVDDQKWQIVLARDSIARQHFIIGVITTGIFCRPGCPARTPLRKNVRFYETPAEARQDGLRPCKRCKPEQPGDGAIIAACRLLESAEEKIDLARLAKTAGLTPGHFQKKFRQQLGVTPAHYQAACRDAKIKAALVTGLSVTEAIYAAGYSAPSRFYTASDKRLGMTPKSYAKGAPCLTIRYQLTNSWLGRTLIAATTKGVCAIFFGDDDAGLTADLQKRFAKATIARAEHGSDFDIWVDQTLAAIDRPQLASNLPLDIQGTAFQEQVWRALQKVPAGTTATYKEVAEMIAKPSATRAVANACGANPVSVVIPCHRIVRSDGAVSGYHWGVERKRKLLTREKKLCTAK